MTTEILDIRVNRQKFNAVASGDLTFMFAKDDMRYGVGLLIQYQETSDAEQRFCTGNSARLRVTYKLDGGILGLAEGYCILSFKLLSVTRRR